MKKVFCSAVLFFLFLNVITIAQEFRVGDTVICSLNGIKSQKIDFVTGANIGNHHLNQARYSRTTTAENIFDVRYTGFTSQAKAVFEKATEIWSQYLKSDIKVRVLAQWSVSNNINNLGFVIPSEVKDFEGAPLQNVWYPVSLAEKLARKDLNGTGEVDIIANFNSGRNDWYFGLDGNCPSNQFDLLTVILHELGHGLGISGTFFKNGAIGTFGIGGLPKIYDRFIVNGNGQQLITAFQSGTEILGSQLTGNSLEFNSPIAFNFNQPNGVARIFSPSPFNPGSSISHLDQSYNLTNNGLMTPFATPGKVAHNAGPLIKGILYEMGWQHMYLSITPIKDVELIEEAKIYFTIQSDTTYNPNNIKVFYRVGDSGLFTESTANVVSKDMYSFEFKGIPYNNTIQYYVQATDLYQRKFTAPRNDSQPFSFFYGVDNTPPKLTLKTVETEINRFEEEIIFEANATDNLGIKELKLFVYLNNDFFDSYTFISNGESNYHLKLNLAPLNLQDGDKIEYKIIAKDNSSNSNETFLPASGLSKVLVKVFNPLNEYSNTFNTAGAGLLDFYGDFEIRPFIGFQNNAIHSPHPYPKGSNAEPKELIYNFLYPITVLPKNSWIQFDEVVLVKPGAGSDFNNPLFGDYVIIEAKRNSEQNWINMTNGYNSSAFNNWLAYFNSNVTNGDSQSQGTLNYFNNRSINLTEYFNVGDIIEIRFRLKSQSGNNGWGWTIDNFRVNQPITSVIETPSKATLLIYPNPFINTLIISDDYKNELLELEILSIDGKRIKHFNKSYIQHNSQLDVSDLPKGLYFIKSVFKNRNVITHRLMK